MKFSDDNFKELAEQLKVKQPHLNRLKTSIQQQATRQQKSKKPMWLAAFAIFCLIVGTFPFYSPALADFVAKVKPLAIGEQNGGSPALSSDITDYLVANGYNVSSVGVLTKGNVIEIGFNEGIDYDERELEELVKSYLAEQGYDLYTIDFVETKQTEYVGNPIYDEARELVKTVFADFGYAEEAQYELAGLQETWFSNILLLDMPDHIKESDEIVKVIESEIEEQSLNIKKVQVHKFNLAHRLLDNAWGTAASVIYNAMAGKSAYELKGLSYSVKKGHANITLQTAWTEVPSNELASEIEREIIKYLQSDEVMAYLPEQSYTIRFVNNEQTLLEITSK